MPKEIVRKIEKEHGSVSGFALAANKWLDKLPEKYLENNRELKKLRDKSPDWQDPTVLKIANRKFTSVEHADWINSVLGRIEKMKRRVENASLPPVSTRSSMEEKMRKRFRKDKKSALDFMRSVENYTYRNLRITKDQMEALNEIYERYEKLTETSWT